MELDSEHAPVRRGDRSVGIRIGRGQPSPALGERGDGRRVAHPHRRVRLNATKQRTLDAGQPVRPVRPRADVAHLAAGVLHEELHPVADTKQRKARRVETRVGLGRVGFEHRPGTAGEDHCLRRFGKNALERRRARQDDGVGAEFAHAAGNEPRVLRSEVENDDAHAAPLPLLVLL